MYKLERVQYLDTITSNQEKILHYLTKALTKTPEETIESVLSSVLKGVSQLWLATTNNQVVGVVVTEALQHPAKRIMLIHMLGGEDIEEWVGEISRIEAYAKENECQAIEIIGRPAWKKLLPEYKAPRIVLTKELN